MKSRATQTKELDMVNGPLARKILIYSIPLMFSNLLQVFFNMTDVAVVGKFAGARALGSVGSTTIIITLTTGILLGMGGGVNAVTALHMGAEDYRRVHKTVHTSVILCFIAGLLLLVAGYAHRQNGARGIGNTGERYGRCTVIHPDLFPGDSGACAL